VSHLDPPLLDELSLWVVNTRFTSAGLTQVEAFWRAAEIVPGGVEAVLIGLE
jgi:hypothetical protein